MTVSSTSAAAPSAAASTASPLTSLAGNFTDFLKLLMTQLQNQDPTSPMDTNQFTSQLVQFSSVEQQINTNSSLTKLIQATQGNEVLQSSALVGKQVQVATDHIALQGGKGALRFDTAAPQAVSIGIYSDAGTKLRDATVASASGSNTWTWDGRDNAGNVVRDGAYRAVAAAASGAALPFTVLGAVTGMQRSGGAVTVQLGALQTDFSNVQAVVAPN